MPAEPSQVSQKRRDLGHPLASESAQRALLLARYGGECHLFRRTLHLPFPGEENLGVTLGDVLAGSNAQPLGCPIDPARWTFDFTKVSDWRVIEYHVAFVVFPFGAVFLVAK